MPKFNTLDDMDLEGKVVLTRVDVNVPVENGQVTDTTRIDKIIPTVKDIQAKGGIPVLLAHFDRPKGKRVDTMSLKQIVPALEAALGQPVVFADDCIGGPAKRVVAALEPGQIALLENTRFHEGEETNDATFAASLAALGGVYVNDAFSASHRAHASTEGLARLLNAAAGRLMERRGDQSALSPSSSASAASLVDAMTVPASGSTFTSNTSVPLATSTSYPHRPSLPFSYSARTALPLVCFSAAAMAAPSDILACAMGPASLDAVLALSARAAAEVMTAAAQTIVFSLFMCVLQKVPPSRLAQAT